MKLKAMPKIFPFGPEYVLSPPSQSTKLLWGINNLLSMELVFGGEFHANRSSGKWRWLFRNIWKPEVIEISEAHFRFQIWRMLLRYSWCHCPEDVHGVVDATKFFCLHPEFRPGESGRLFPHVWTGGFIPAYAGPASILYVPDQEAVHLTLSPSRQQASTHHGRMTDIELDPIGREASHTMAETSHPQHQRENRNDPAKMPALKPAKSTQDRNRVFSPARSFECPN